MHLDKYDLIEGDDITQFEFWSEGSKGQIRKSIHFQPTGLPYVLNLAFGDLDIKTGGINDFVTTNNGDSEKVLATVVSAVYVTTGQLPDMWIYAMGSTPSRTRLYQMGINKYYDIVVTDFEVIGRIGSQWGPYQRGKNYDALAVRRKNV